VGHGAHDAASPALCTGNAQICIICLQIVSTFTSTQGKTMEIKHILIIMFVVFCLFMLANWFNRPKKSRK
jgi:hypothetical protein